jgi:hypothetical protein
MEIGKMSDTISFRSTLNSEIRLMAVAYPAAIVLGLSLLAFQGLSGVQIFTFSDKAAKGEPSSSPTKHVTPLPLEPVNNIAPGAQVVASAEAQRNSPEEFRNELIENNRALQAEIAELHRTVADLTAKTASLQNQYATITAAQPSAQSQKNIQYWEFSKPFAGKSFEAALYGTPFAKELVYNNAAGMSPMFECKLDFPRQLLKCSDSKEFILKWDGQSGDQWMNCKSGLPARDSKIEVKRQ